MHGTIEIMGPGAWALAAFFLVVAGLCLYVFIDAIRRPAVDYTGVPEGRWVYATPALLFFVAYAMRQIPYILNLWKWLGMGVVFAVLPALALVIAYLLRVVFPTHARLAARAEARDAAAGNTGATGDEEPLAGGDVG